MTSQTRKSELCRRARELLAVHDPVERLIVGRLRLTLTAGRGLMIEKDGPGYELIVLEAHGVSYPTEETAIKLALDVIRRHMILDELANA